LNPILSGGAELRPDAYEHEFNHGLYFTNKKYNEAAKNLFREFPQKVQIKAVQLFQQNTELYNPNDEDLLIRELIAYFHGPLELIFDMESDGALVSAVAKRVHSLDAIVPEYRNPN
jgi:hypothetical protein